MLRTGIFRTAGYAALLSAVFAASWAMARPAPEKQLAHALQAVRSDRANLVCAPGVRCSVDPAPYVLFVFFSIRDCPISLYDLAVLDSLARTLPPGRLSLVAVGHDLDHDEARALAAASELSYPLYLRPREVERYVDNPRPDVTNKPVAVLVARDGTVLRRVTARTTVEWLRQDAEAIRREVLR